MKIAATYEKETGNIFQHFGKTQYFKIYEIEDGKILSSEVIDNGGNGHHALPPYRTHPPIAGSLRPPHGLRQPHCRRRTLRKAV